MAYYSTVRDAMANLASACENSTVLVTDLGVKVLDGPIVSGDLITRSLKLGWSSPSEGVPAVSGRSDPEDYSQRRDRERYGIMCAIEVASGDTNALPDRRGDVMDIYDAVGDVIAQDRTLGGAVMRCWLGEFELHQMQVNRGVWSQIRFTVECDAFSPS